MHLAVNKIILFFVVAINLNSATGQKKDSLVVDKYGSMSLQEMMGIEIKLGTRGQKRKIFDSPVPIDIITAHDIEQSGFISTGEAVQSLLPSFNYVRSTITDGSDHIRVSTLRGLGPDQVLVLINGKRRHNTALLHINSLPGRGSTGIDFDAIPISIIERIEVLRDGSAAQYGSDAIAGIVNIILKEDSLMDLNTYYGLTNEGDGQVKYLSFPFGTPILNNGNFNFTLEIKEKEMINRAGPDTRQQYFEGDPRNNDPALNNLINHRVGEPDFNELSFFTNVSIPIEKNTFYLFGGINQRNSVAGGFYRRSLDNRNVRDIYPDGFLPLISPSNKDLFVSVGFKGKYKEWNWDLSFSYGNNILRFNVENSVNVSLGTNSPKDFYAGSLLYAQRNINYDINKSINTRLKEDINVGIGFELRNERYQISAGEEDSYIDGGVQIIDGPDSGNAAPIGAQVFPGFSPHNKTDKSRMATSLYIDLEQPVGKLLLGLAVRYEKNYEFGNTLNGKFTIRHQPLSSLALRSSFSTGYRAPSLAQSYFTSTATIFAEDGTPYQVGTYSVDHPLAISLGASPLKPEQSKHASAGFIFEPTTNFQISLDGFWVDINERIVLSGDFTNNINEFGAEIASLLESYGVSGARFFTNAIYTRSYGADIAFNYNINLSDFGILECYAGGHYNKTRLRGEVKTPEILNDFQKTLFTREEQSRIEESQPNDIINLRLVYKNNKFQCAIKAIRFGEIKSKHHTDPLRDESYGVKAIYYMNLSYHITEKIKISLGGNNLLNTMPDPKKEINNFGGIFPYNFYTQYGVGGAFYYSSLSFSF